MGLIRKFFSLFKIYEVKNDRTIVLTAIALCIFGALMITSANMGIYAGNSLKIAIVMFKQSAYFLVGLFFMWTFSYFNFKTEIDSVRFYKYLIFLFFFLLTPLAMGNNVSGAYAWIDLKIITIQPSEFVKLFFIINLPRYLSNKDKNAKEHAMRFVYASLICFGFFGVIFLGQRDLGSSIAFLGICLFILFTCEDRCYVKPKRFLFYFVSFVTCLAVFSLTPIGTKIIVAVLGDGYKAGRFLAAENPFAHQYGVGYHLVLSLVSCANGGWLGQGFASSIHKYMNFPNVDNDFILPIVIEEMGFLFGFGFIVVAYSFICFRLFKMMRLKKADNRLRMTLMGVVAYLLLHFVLNVGGVTGFIPLTGVPLLLISAGGSSIFAFLAALGYGLAEIKRVKEK